MELTSISPNASPTPRQECRGVCFHHTVKGFQETIAYMLRPGSQVSYHVVVARDGLRCRLVEDHHIAWHAGASSFQGRTRCNDFLLGFAFEGDTYAAPLTEAQIDSALAWLASRWTRHGWTLDWMTDHRQIAPGRKDDLNPVEWERLRAAIAARFG